MGYGHRPKSLTDVLDEQFARIGVPPVDDHQFEGIIGAISHHDRVAGLGRVADWQKFYFTVHKGSRALVEPVRSSYPDHMTTLDAVRATPSGVAVEVDGDLLGDAVADLFGRVSVFIAARSASNTISRAAVRTERRSLALRPQFSRQLRELSP
jgi:hypothetical protein